MNIFARIERFKGKKGDRLYEQICRYGNPQEVLLYIDRMPILSEEKGWLHEVRLDDRFLVFCRKKELFICQTAELHAISNSRSEDTPPKCRFQVFTTDGRREDFVVPYGSRSDQIFALLRKYAAIDQELRTTWIPKGDREREYTERGHYHLKLEPGALTVTEFRVFRAHKVTVLPTADLVWLEQTYSEDSEGGDLEYLDLYTVSGASARLFASQRTGYELMLRIKHYCPHLLYGSDIAYEAQYKRDPAVLQLHGKSLLTEEQKKTWEEIKR